MQFLTEAVPDMLTQPHLFQFYMQAQAPNMTRHPRSKGKRHHPDVHYIHIPDGGFSPKAAV
jgi:hypothetical protein